MKKTIYLALFAFLAVFASTGVSFAQDPLAVAPEMYKLKFENDAVRVMEVTFQPGEAIAEHSHPGHFAYVVEAGKLTITKEGASNEVELNEGDVIWMDAETHSAVNTGTTLVRLLVVEPK